MGCSCGSTSSSSSTERDIKIKNYKELPNQTVGEGIKQTIAWSGLISRGQLTSIRETFWRSRHGGSRHIWLTLRQACETDSETAREILNATEIEIIDGIMTKCKDVNGQMYELPIYIINDPVQFSDVEKQPPPPKKTSVVEKDIELLLRHITLNQDFKVNVNTFDDVAQLKAMFQQHFSDSQQKSIRMIFGGKEMKNGTQIGTYGVDNGFVVQAMIVG